MGQAMKIDGRRCAILVAFNLGLVLPAKSLPAVPPLNVKVARNILPPRSEQLSETPTPISQVQRLALGGQTLIALPAPATRIALGDPGVADVRLLSPTQWLKSEHAHAHAA